MRLVVERMKRGEGSVRTLFSVVMVVAVLASVLSLGAFSQPVQADGVINATASILPDIISVSISYGYPTSVDYGAVPAGGEGTPISYDPNTHNWLQVTNDGNVVEDLLIRGDDAFSIDDPTNDAKRWLLSSGDLPGLNTYCHLFGLGAVPTSYSFMHYDDGSFTNEFLADNVTVGGTVDFNLKIQMAIVTLHPEEHSTTVTVTATAA